MHQNKDRRKEEIIDFRQISKYYFFKIVYLRLRKGIISLSTVGE